MAARFWVGGTGTWDGADTTHWAASSGGAGGQSVPTTTDTVTFDASSGGGTVTLNTDFSIQSFTMGAFTGTIDCSANNNSPTVTTLSITGTGARTFNMGSGTWTVTAGNGATVVDATTVTNLTATFSNCTINLTGAGNKTFVGNSTLTWGTVNNNSSTLGSKTIFSTATTITTMGISAGNGIQCASGGTVTITNAPTWTGTSSNGISLDTNGSSATTIAISSGAPSLTWAFLGRVTFTGTTGTATNSIASGGQSGITVTAPSGSSVAHVIGG